MDKNIVIAWVAPGQEVPLTAEECEKLARRLDCNPWHFTKNDAAALLATIAWLRQKLGAL